MSDTKDKTETDEKTKARGKKEKQLNEQAAAEQAEVKRGEQEAEAIEQEQDAPPAEPTDPDQLRGEIAEAREELGDTVEALAAKADVKAQAKDKVDEQKARAQAKVDETTAQVKDNPTPVAAVAGGVVAFLLLVLLLKRRRS